jgi:hypothetical protein
MFRLISLAACAASSLVGMGASFLLGYGCGACAPGGGAGAESRRRACCRTCRAESFAKNGFTARGLNSLSGAMPTRRTMLCHTLVPVSWAL